MSPTANSAVRDRLRIAIQKSGRLSEPARALLAFLAAPETAAIKQANGMAPA